MAFRAFTFLLAFFKLALVRVGFVAIAAIGEGERLLEIAIQVTRDAGNLGMFSDQRILRFGVIEIEAGQAEFFQLLVVWQVSQDFLNSPLWGSMWHAAAGVEFHVLIACGSARRIGLVAFFAGNLYVQAGERIFRFGVIEILGSLPAFHVVALGAFVSELALVRIGVAGSAIRGLAEERLRQVFHFDEFTICRKHMRRRVTFFTRKWSVFAL